MKANQRILALALLAALVAAPGLWAQRRPYVFDRAHSQVNFVAEALLLTAHGYFERFDAEVHVDAENIENSTVRFTIEAASINTRNERRDNHLRSADFFDATNHPQITFVSTKVARANVNHINITGDLTIRGVTKTIEAPTHIVFIRDGRARFKGEFQINRQDFNVSYNSRANPIEDIVKVQFDLNLMDEEMRRQAPAKKSAN